VVQHALENDELARVSRVEAPVAASLALGVIGRKKVFAAWKVLRKVEQFRVVDKLAQETNRLEGLRVLAAEKCLDLLRVDKVIVERGLERARATEDNVLILDRD